MRLARAEQGCATLTMPKKRASDTIRLATVQCTKKKKSISAAATTHTMTVPMQLQTTSNLSATQSRQTLPDFAERSTDTLDAIGADVDQRTKKTHMATLSPVGTNPAWPRTNRSTVVRGEGPWTAALSKTKRHLHTRLRCVKLKYRCHVERTFEQQVESRRWSFRRIRTCAADLECYGEISLALMEFARPTLICFVKNADSST